MDDDGVADPESNEYYQIVKKRAEAEGAQVIPICAKTEEDLAGMDAEEREMFMEELGLSDSGLNRLIKASYALLGLISFLTDGKKECRAWTIRQGTKAPQAAGKIHTDFERGFIRAQVIAFDVLKECGFDYAAVKAKGLQRTEGKEYVVKDGDIIEFLFNV
jgi:ribosome-binding ATPase YchF (GTP1/OBG family)